MVKIIVHSSTNNHFVETEELGIKIVPDQSIKAKKEFSLKHNEHETLTFNPGVYKVGFVQMEDPITRESLRVRD